ncbi:MAG: gliding motility-associated C-terminal domain-containing protein [Saprospiraceae bacterium]|nr:gliding motility-associated C-terminal domain-containing protein [Saprospiraceae bacterium]
MKQIYIALFVILYFFNIQQSQAQVTDGLIAYYPFDNGCTWVDYSNFANSNGTPCGANPQCVCGVEGQAVKLNGLDNCALLLGVVNNYFSSTDFSLSFYLRPGAAAGRQTIFSKREDCTETKAFYVTYSPGVNIINAELIENSGKKHILSAKLDSDRCWHHIVLVRSGSTAKLFVNGNLQPQAQSTTTSRVNIINNAVLNVGAPCAGSADRYFSGELDEIRIYDKALSKQEIESLDFHPEQILTPDTIIYLGSPIMPRISENCDITYSWSPTDGISDPTDSASLITPTQAGNFVYSLTFKLGACNAKDSMRITVIDPTTLPCDKVYLPNAFTPNGDNINDRFGVSNPYAIQEFISLEIFDRWGGRVFFTDNPLTTWDGTANGQLLNPGVFLYKIRFKCDNKEISDFGSLTIVR